MNKHALNLMKQPPLGGSGAVEEQRTREVPPFLGFPELFWRRRWLIIALCAATTALGLLSAARTDPKYSATAILDGDDREVAANPLNAGPPSEGEVSAAVRLRSPAMARRVAQRLGLDAPASARDPNSPGLVARVTSAVFEHLPSVGRLFSRNSATSPSALDLAARQLAANLLVSIEPRSSLISVTYTSTDPAVAARTANTFVAEYLRDQRVRRISDRENTAQRALTELAQTFGPKHPQVVRAQANMHRAREQLRSEMQQTEAMSTDDFAANGRVVPATATTIPLGRGTFTFLILGLLAGLLLGAAAAVVLGLGDPAFRRALMERWINLPASSQRNVGQEDS